MSISEIPTDELQSDLADTEIDIQVCELALAQGVTRYGTNKSVTYTQNTANIGKTPKRQYRTVTELIEEIKTCVKPHYAGTGLTRSQIAADMRKNCNSREGAFWEFVSRQTANFRPLDLDLAMGQVAYQVETYGVDFNLNAHADRTLGGAPAAVLNTAPTAEPPVISLDELDVVASVTAPAPMARVVYTAPASDSGEEIDHPLDCYEDNETPALKPGFEETDQEVFDRLAMPRRMRDLWELKDWFKRTKNDRLPEYQKLTGRDVSAGFIGSLDYMIRNLEEAMDTFQAEVEAGHVNQ